ncbi:ribonuclease G [Bifidobacterium sp. UTCIF-37]|uniref:Rne/Rng family ribonuclease n=1 Tax=unclassified Bifidobacterium TaxID=2608897 RepID=UPI00112CEC70|nr:MULTISPECIES: Rne/Rng family ribonuclease [unclassified Bifidobacterium]TPF85511.1 ribonuclease G [Bifidobacterium sp. UTCIF-37]TPF87560.1 ribonuclease G [Bifidobacterium sp. UTCIF-38]
MQHAGTRSIVPAVNNNGVDDVDAQNATVSNTNTGSDDATADSNAVNTPAGSDGAPTTTRRRRGRRVVRGAGAAGVSLELKVEDHSAAMFEEPRLPEPQSDASADNTSDAPASDNTPDDDAPSPRRKSRVRRAPAIVDASDEDERPTRRRRVRHADDFDDDDARPARRSRRRDDDDLERAEELLDGLPFHDRYDRDDDRDEYDDYEISRDRGGRRSRPMTSLLFQEPVIPAHGRDDDDDIDIIDIHADDDSSDNASDNGSDDADETRASRRETRRRTRSRAARQNASQQDDKQDDARTGRANRADRSDADPAGRVADQQNADDQANENENASGHRRTRSRRLNAQERRAAAEVEQIEEDLELDDISYRPIDDEEPADEEPRTRTRRRRRRGKSEAIEERRASREDRDDRDERDREDRDEEPVEEETVTRTRRRRRRGKSQDDDEQIISRRSRKQQYIDEITDVEGSTRLEAKKQRRRDNRRERSRQSQIMEQDFLARRENVERLMVVREKEKHTQISVVEDNILVEHYVSDIQEVQTVGNVYLGRVQNVLPSMEAAFVDIGQARNGVLYAGEVNWDATRLEGQPRRIELAFKSGDPVLVQVTKDPIGHKGARLTSQVTLAGRFLVLVPSGGMTGVSRKLPERERARLKNIVAKIAPKDMGVIIRTAAEGASEDAIVKDLESLVRQWNRINAKREEFWHGKRPKLLQGEPDVAIRVVRDIFNDDFSQLIVEGDKVYDRIEEYLETMAPDLKDKLVKWDPAEHNGKDVFDKWQIDSQLRKGMERQVYLPSGGSIVIDRTEAMTTIDVNTGRFIGRGKSLEETVTRCNLEASEEIARQLRLRDIGGMIMIDYVDMVMPANRDLVLRRLVECLARDRTKHQVAEVTSLGLVQMTRKRIGQGLVEAFSEECPTCKGRGFILHDKPIVSAEYDDPYALRGGDPFVRTNKHGRGTTPAPEPAGSRPDVKAKLAQIAAAAVAANNADIDD